MSTSKHTCGGRVDSDSEDFCKGCLADKKAREDRGLTPPRVHMNGTIGETLVDGYRDACEALQDALEKVRSAVPNARDYYVVSDDAYRKAREEHDRRFRALEDVMLEYQALAESVQDQIDERAKGRAR